MSLPVSPGEIDWGSYEANGVVQVAKQKRQTTQAVKDGDRPRNEARTAENKRKRVDAQELRRQANVVRRHMEVPTPWEVQKQRRASRPARWTLAA